MTTEDAVKIVEEVKPEIVVTTHFGMQMIFSGPTREAKLIEQKTGTPTMAAVDGMRISVGEDIWMQRPKKKLRGLDHFTKGAKD